MGRSISANLHGERDAWEPGNSHPISESNASDFHPWGVRTAEDDLISFEDKTKIEFPTFPCIQFQLLALFFQIGSIVSIAPRSFLSL